MLKKQLFRTLIITFALITLIYGFILIPFERQRLNTVEEKIKISLDAIMEQRIADMGNMLFMKDREGLALLSKRIKKLDGIVSISTYDNQGFFLTSTQEGEKNFRPGWNIFQTTLILKHEI